MPEQSLTCSDCQKTFAFTEQEQAFFQERGFAPPKRCPECRKARRARQGGGGGGGGGGGDLAQMTAAGLPKWLAAFQKKLATGKQWQTRQSGMSMLMG
ncbi:MAG: zinc-ribbon domain-containing protein, partial [Planctomycetes bacterium]|nr:zinc-ribbon domain-containing protein [Planctomycetota bacterium]